MTDGDGPGRKPRVRIEAGFFIFLKKEENYVWISGGHAGRVLRVGFCSWTILSIDAWSILRRFQLQLDLIRSLLKIAIAGFDLTTSLVIHGSKSQGGHSVVFVGKKKSVFDRWQPD